MNYLPNGTVLPFGLMGVGDEASVAGFNKTYRNSALRLGIVVKSYDVSEEKNLTKLTTEYDVLVFEQQEDRGSSLITYRNCISAEGMGSVADFFEKTIRVREHTDDSQIVNTSGQTGAIVLLLCLDAVTEKAIIIGAVTHPDRTSTLAGKTRYLEGEFNGVNIKINEDGSTSLVFKGSTDNDGNQDDSSQGNTTAKIETDGSFQLDHKTITFRLDKDGNATLTATEDVTVNCKDAIVNAQEEATINCKDSTVNADENSTINCKEANVNCTNSTVTATDTATVEGQHVKLGAGAAEAVIKGDTFKKMVFDTHIHPTPIGPSGPPSTPMSPDSLSIKVKTE